MPGYLENAKSFADSGVQGIYIVAVNDIFCVNAWEEKLSSGNKTHDLIHFVSDGTGHFTNAMGQMVRRARPRVDRVVQPKERETC